MQSLPYIIEEGQDTEMQEEIEMASVLLIALSRQENVYPDAIVKVNYPFMVHDVEGETVVFDLLALSKTEKKWLLPYDVSDILTELEAAEDDRILGLLNKGIQALDSEPNYGSTWVKGMIDREDMTTYLYDSIKPNHIKKEKLALFKPVLTKRKFSSIRKNIKSIQKEIDEYIASTVEARERLETRREVIQETQEKNLSVFKKDSKKRFDALNKEKDKAIKTIEKALKKEVKTISDEFNERHTSITTEMTATEEEIEKQKKIIESGAVGDEKRRLADLEKLLKSKIMEIKTLEFERQNRFNKAEKMAESLKQQWENRIQTMSDEEEKLLGELLETHEMNLKSCDDFLKKISDIVATFTRDKESLSKISDIKYEKGTAISMPFYLFNFGEENYGFSPPIKVSEEKGMRKMLKLFIANNLENKIGRFISPQTEVFDEILETVIDSIKEKTELSDQYMKTLSETNLLESSETLDKMMVGLYQIMEWNWIREKDYIQVQRFLVEKLDSLHGGTVFQFKQQVKDEILDIPAAMETAVIE